MSDANFNDVNKSVGPFSGDNRPMSNPDYYSPSRPYYGMWADCYSREELMAIPTYVQLKQRADSGDIEAMLDIASGFLSAKIDWLDYQFISVPYSLFSRYGEDYDAYKWAQDHLCTIDVRYYYWAFKAVRVAYDRYEKGLPFPAKYIATAVLDTMKFGISVLLDLYADYINRVKNLTIELKAISDSMFGDTISFENFMMPSMMLLDMMQRFGNDIISPVHQETTPLRIKYLGYIHIAYFDYVDILENKADDQVLENRVIAIREEDLGKKTMVSLTKYDSDPVCYKYHKALVDCIEAERKKRGIGKRPDYYGFTAVNSNGSSAQPYTPQQNNDYSNYGQPVSRKSRTTAGVLAILLGGLGAHKLYLGYYSQFVIMLVVSLFTFGIITGIIGIAEGIIYLSKTDDEFNDTYVVNRRYWF